MADTSVLTSWMSVWNRYSRKLGNGDWNPDSGMSHAVEAGRTLCGTWVGKIAEGWERNTYANRVGADSVSCRRCLKSLEVSRG